MKPLTNQISQKTVTFDPSWKSILECAALEVFEMMAGVRLEVIPSPQEEPSGERTAMVGMAGALCGMTTIRCSKSAAAQFASLMLGANAGENPSAANDALGELCNMVAGNFKSKITNLADHCLLSVPTVITGEDYAMQTAEPSDETNVALRFEGSPVWVSLIIHS
jgi:chemotaxis protein CheX